MYAFVWVPFIGILECHVEKKESAPQTTHNENNVKLRESKQYRLLTEFFIFLFVSVYTYFTNKENEPGATPIR